MSENNPIPVVLIVDDDEDSRVMLRTLLEIWNYCVYEASDGEEAIRLAAQMRPDLILMDIIMPQLDGFDAARQIRESAGSRDVPIVFLTGCAETLYRPTADDAGGNAYLVKPVNFEQLSKMLGQFIRRSPAGRPEFPPESEQTR